MQSADSIRPATEADRRGVLDVITLAFAIDPLVRWMIPDPTRYLATMPETVDAFGGRGFAYDSVYVAAEFAGAALWLPPGVEPEGERLLGLVRANAPNEVRDDAMQVFAEMGKYHPAEPHWVLPLIGVDPAQQGRGLGAALMQRALARIDRERVPAYLESSNPRNIPLYQRFGFEILGQIRAGTSPPVTPMLRARR